MWRFYKFILLLLIGMSILSSCLKREDYGIIEGEDDVYVFVNKLMKEWYLWNDKVPNIDIQQFNTPSELLDELMYTPPDYWSFIAKAEVVESMFEEGEYFGFGFMLKFDLNGNLRIPLVYNNSEAYDLGIRRGNHIVSINGISPELFDDYDSFFDNNPATFSFEIYDNNDQINTISLDKSNIEKNGVLFSNIYNVSEHQTGYIVYDSFLGYTQTDLEDVLLNFKANNISELIVDLRYNGGGYISLAQELCEIIMPAETAGKNFLSAVHNASKAEVNDNAMIFSESDLNLDLDRVFFITTDQSASASELVINALEPYMDVLIIGSATYGKPVGMYGFEFEDWVMYPVTAQILNADGFGDYFDGLIPDAMTEDGLSYDWGDETEPCLSQAFHYISFGNWDNTLAIKSGIEVSVPIQYWSKKNILILDK